MSFLRRLPGLFFNQDGGAAAGGGGSPAAGAAGGGAPAGGSATTAGAGTPPPATAAAPAGAAPATPSDWVSGITDESLRGYAANKGWKSPADAVHSYLNLEKLHGVPAEQIVKLPKDAAAPEWNDVYKRLGRPDKPDGYTIPAPQGAQADPAFVKWAQDTFHGANLTAKQAEVLASKWNEFQGTTAKAHADAQAAKLKDETESLKKEWGGTYDQNLEIAKRGVAKLGLDGDFLDKLEGVIGKAKVIKTMHKLGASVGEGTFVDGNGGTGPRDGARTPAEAQARLASLKADKNWVTRYLAKDADAIKEANDLMALGWGTESA
jgi:hypothetical protein